MTADVPRPLRRRWWLTALGFLFAALAVTAVAARQLGTAAAVRWLAVAAVPLGYALWLLRDSLTANRPPAELEPDEPTAADGGARVVPTFGLANAVTLARGWLYAGVAGFLLVVPAAGSGWRWLPVAWYGTGAALDWVDGALARTVGRPSRLGARLDLAFDTLGFLVAPLVAVAWGRLPVWYLSLSAARYLFKLGCWTRRRRGLPVGELPESSVRRPLAGLQMAFITAALLPVVPVGPLRVAAALVLLPSLAVFARDYLVVAGYVGEANCHTDSAR